MPRGRRKKTPPLTLALIGAGRWGKNIQRTLASIPACNLLYVETRAWKYLTTIADLDGVLIATPGSTHAEVALPFIERGIPTFIEKPLTTSLRDALALQRAAEKSRTRVFVGHVHLYNPAFLKAKALARRAGRIRVLFAEGMNNGPYRDDMSALWDWAPHDLAMALDLLGRSPIAVQAAGFAALRPQTTLHDVVTVHLRFREGMELFGTYSWLAPEKRKRFTIVGTKDTIVFDDTAEQKVTVYRGLGPTVDGAHVHRSAPEVFRPPYSPTPSLTAELHAFLSMVRTGQKPRSDLQQSIDVVRILDASEKSIAHSGRWIRL